MTTTARGDDRERLFTRMVEHGATQVAMAELMEQAQVVWLIGADEPVSETCIHAEELMASGARSCRSALDVMARMERAEGAQDADLVTALKKYVQDTCEAIKQVDNALKEKGSDLATLLFEVPDRSPGEISWRDLIGRRDVIAHQLLTIDDKRIQHEAQRDFGLLHKLLSWVYFAPVKTNLKAGRGFGPMLKTDVVRGLLPAKPGSTPTIGQSLIFVCEDEKQGLVAFRAGRTEKNGVLFAGLRGTHRISVAGLNLDIP